MQTTLYRYIGLILLFGCLAGLIGLSGSASTAAQSISATPQLYLPAVIRQGIPTQTLTPTQTPTHDGLVVQRFLPAFDKCDTPDLAQLQAWWNESPYYIINLYIGGVARYPLCKHLRLNADWVKAAAQQGWEFIPTWAGPQAPCSTVTKHPMPYDIGEAYALGRQNADEAVITAASLGLTTAEQKGSIIYYDMEAYGGASTGEGSPCRLAVSAFLNGWNERLHELGNKSGIYGGGCSSYARDWAVLPNPPDDVWLAYWKYDRFDPEASVWDIPCVRNDLWANHQRIRQYAGGHNEQWGSVTFNIDSNIVDGEIVSLLTATSMPTSTPTLALTPTPTLTPTETTSPTITPTFTATPTPTLDLPPASNIILECQQPAISGKLQSFQALSSDTVWVLAGGKMLWTDTGGCSWAEIDLPATGAIGAAFWLDHLRGWILSLDGDAARLWITQNGGTTWQTAAAPNLTEPAEWVPLSLQFSNTQEGWLVFKRITSANFDIRAIYQTSNGGQTWQEVDAAPEGLTDWGWRVVTVGECRRFKSDCSTHTLLQKLTYAGRSWTTVLSP